MTPKTYAIYLLREGENGPIRYFGITRCGVEKRFSAHIKSCDTEQSKKADWIRQCQQSGIGVTCCAIKTGLTKSRACRLERLLISFFLNAFQLTNTQAGGNTGSPAKLKLIGSAIGYGTMAKCQIEIFATSKKSKDWTVIINGTKHKRPRSLRGVWRAVARMSNNDR